VPRPTSSAIAHSVTLALVHLVRWTVLISFAVLAIRTGLQASVDGSVATLIFGGVFGWIMRPDSKG
jgi:hypothetical protein